MILGRVQTGSDCPTHYHGIPAVHLLACHVDYMAFHLVIGGMLQVGTNFIRTAASINQVLQHAASKPDHRGCRNVGKLGMPFQGGGGSGIALKYSTSNSDRLAAEVFGRG
jgi:hypothetical protein